MPRWIRALSQSRLKSNRNAGSDLLFPASGLFQLIEDFRHDVDRFVDRALFDGHRRLDTEPRGVRHRQETALHELHKDALGDGLRKWLAGVLVFDELDRKKEA